MTVEEYVETYTAPHGHKADIVRSTTTASGCEFTTYEVRAPRHSRVGHPTLEGARRIIDCTDARHALADADCSTRERYEATALSLGSAPLSDAECLSMPSADTCEDVGSIYRFGLANARAAAIAAQVSEDAAAVAAAREMGCDCTIVEYSSSTPYRHAAVTSPSGYVAAVCLPTKAAVAEVSASLIRREQRLLPIAIGSTGEPWFSERD